MMKTIGTALMSTGIVTGLLFLYFDWRARLLNGMRSLSGK